MSEVGKNQPNLFYLARRSRVYVCVRVAVRWLGTEYTFSQNVCTDLFV